MGYRKWLCCALLCGAVVAPPANAEVAGTTLEISQEVYSPEGHPVLVANAVPEGGKPIAWQRCFPDAATCVQLPGTPDVLEPGATAAGTVFKASVFGAPVPEVVTSRTWQGTLAATTPPSVVGSPKVGQIVKGVAGSWLGGWGSDRDSLTVVACKNPASETCDVVTGAWQVGDKYIDRPILPAHVGWSLYAINTRLSGDEVFPLILLGRTRPNPLLKPLAIGSISSPLGPVTEDPSYAVEIRKRARYFRSGSALLGQVRCAAGCKFRATIQLRLKKPSGKSGPRSRTVIKRLALNDRLVLRRSQLRRAISARVTITDRYQVVAERTVLLRRP